MNLWGRFAGSLFFSLILVVACQEDDTSLLGFKSSSDKLKVSYVEIEVPSSVMLIDSVRTYNDANQRFERRLMVGKYVDNNFGEITAETYTQFSPVNPIVDIPASAKLVSGFLILSFDFYHYGGAQTSTETFTVHQLLDSIPSTDPSILPLNIQGVTNYQTYYFNSSIPYNLAPIGTAAYEINPAIFDETLSGIKNDPGSVDHKTIDTLSVKLNTLFTTALFDLARGQTNDYTVSTRFRRIFKGLVIRADNTNSKILGFNPDIDSTTFSKSRIVLNYDEVDPTTGNTVRKILEYSIFQLTQASDLIGFTRISADRGSSPLAALLNPNIGVELDGNRYYQSGNPVTTKISFSKFLEFSDTIPNLIFNSVQLSIEVDDTETFDPPSTLRLRYLNSSNEFVNFFSNIEAESNLPLYPASMTYDEEGWFIVGQRLSGLTVGPLFDLSYSPVDKRYTGDFTDFIQTLYDIKDEEFRYTDYAIVAATPQIGLSVNRTIFNKNKLKLKVFYTVPLESQ